MPCYKGPKQKCLYPLGFPQQLRGKKVKEKKKRKKKKRAVKLSPNHNAYDKIIQVKGDNFRNVLA